MNLPSQPSLDDLIALYAAGPEAVCAAFQEVVARQVALEERVIAAEAHNRVLQLKIDDLTARLNKDSSNSNKPPSSDGLRKPPAPPASTFSLRKKSGRKSGGQKGHPGSTLKYCDTPDEFVEHRPECCESCSQNLCDTASVVEETRQVFDVPPPTLKCTQHNSHWITCPKCGNINRGRFPAHITSGVQYGENIAATVLYLANYQFVPYRRTVELIRSLYNVCLSEGTVHNICTRANAALEGVSTKIDIELIASETLNCDESGVRVCGMLYWLHTVSNKLFTAYTCSKNRGLLGMKEMGILLHYHGRAVHDFWAPYFKLPCLHALCNAHLLRELVAVYKNFAQSWANDLHDVLVECNNAVKLAKAQGKTRLSNYMLRKLNRAYDAAIEAGLKANPPIPGKKPGRNRNTKAGALVRRLQSRKPEILAHLYDFRVPFDNNQAEQDIRMIKVKQKVSGGFRSLEGAKMFCRIRGYLSTMKKQGFDMFEVLISVCRLNPIQPNFSSA